MQITHTFLDRIYELLSKRAAYHLLFWLVVYSSLLFLDYGQNHDIRLAVANETITLAFYVIIAYTNLLYLVPKWMRRSIPLYGLILVAFCVLITPIQVLALFLQLSGDVDFQAALIDQQPLFLLGNISLALLTTVLHIVMDWWRYQQEKKELITRTMESELRLLKSQINPHFLFNTLNNLYALTLKKSDLAPEIVLKLSEIMRYMLYECNERQVLLSKEIQYLNNYLDLERLRQPEGASIHFEVLGSVSNQLIAPLLLVPFVENSFKHGLNHQINGGGYVHLKLEVAFDQLIFEIENAKFGHLPATTFNRSGGIGLVNVRQRLQLLYPDRYHLEIKDEPHFYRVILYLDLGNT